MFKLLKIFVVIALFIALLAFLLRTVEEKSEDELVVGLQSGYPPFEYMNSQGEIVGFDIDMATKIAEKMNKSLVVKDMDFDGEILSLKQGKIDLIISGMNITPTRLRELTLIPYHGEAATHLSLVFWNEIPTGIHSFEDLLAFNQPISVEAGTLPEIFLNDYYPLIETKAFQGALAPLMDVKFHKSLATLVEPDVASYLEKKHSEAKVLTLPLPKEAVILGFGIGVKKENKELAEKVEKIVKELKESGELKALENKWFLGEN